MTKIAPEAIEPEEELSAREELEEIAAFLHDADIEEKEAKARKEKIRPAFFALISEVVRDEIPLARKTVRVDDPNIDPEEWRAFNEPAWRIVAINPDADGFDLTLEENEDLVKFEFEVGGFKFGRTIRMEGKDFKAEAFYEAIAKARLNQNMGKHDDPLLEMFDNDVLNHLEVVVSKKQVPVYEVDEDKALELMTEYPETVAFFQQFMFPGTPKPALMPIKKSKEKNE